MHWADTSAAFLRITLHTLSAGRAAEGAGAVARRSALCITHCSSLPAGRTFQATRSQQLAASAGHSHLHVRATGPPGDNRRQHVPTPPPTPHTPHPIAPPESVGPTTTCSLKATLAATSCRGQGAGSRRTERWPTAQCTCAHLGPSRRCGKDHWPGVCRPWRANTAVRPSLPCPQEPQRHPTLCAKRWLTNSLVSSTCMQREEGGQTEQQGPQAGPRAGCGPAPLAAWGIHATRSLAAGRACDTSRRGRPQSRPYELGRASSPAPGGVPLRFEQRSELLSAPL